MGRQLLRYRHLLIYLAIPLLAFVQLFVASRSLDPTHPGRWFLYGRDTFAHDAVVQVWIQQQVARAPFTIPLWIAEVQGGLPSVGSFLWTPFAPQAWAFLFLEFPEAQKAAWWLCLVIAGFGGLRLGRVTGLRAFPALFTAVAWMLAGHLVTLIHAGHFQKVMALAWLPWMLAGATQVGRLPARRHLMGGIATGAFGLAMMLLCGHPQIAWLGMVCSVVMGGWFLALRRGSLMRRTPAVLGLIALIAVGLCTAGPQLLPGVEMSALSNRASGVSFEEAVETSYPPGEIAEFVMPRFKGSSVFGDEYRGEWGERIVSDHAGLVFVSLACLSVVGAGWRRAAPWLLLGGFFLVVGLGRYTPLYSFLYIYAPGFKSFRSPGTFFAATALAIPVLAGIGVSHALQLARRFRWRAQVAGGVLALGIVSLLAANMHFLFAFPWAQYQRDFLSPTELDLWLGEKDRALDVHDAASDLSLRPILFGRRSLRGYHPISYGARLADDDRLGYNTLDWFQANGVRLVVAPLSKEPIAEHFPTLGRSVVPFSDMPGIVSGVGLDSVEWVERTPNVRKLRLSSQGGEVRVRETLGPGMEVWLNGSLVETADSPELETTVTVPAGESELVWLYRPFSWRAGLFLGALGLGLVAFALGYSKRAVPTRTIVAPSSIATS
ncbi:hypothetical protein GC173_01700 [bacterium]|nr:hypothetical protein [bacterium]